MKLWHKAVALLLSLISISWCEKPPLKPTRVLSDGENKAYVYDGVFGKRLLAVTKEMVISHATWNFEHPDPYHGIEKKDNGDLHWYAPFSPKGFSNSLIWKALKKGLRGTGVLDGKEFLPVEVHGVMLLRGFSPVVYKGRSEGDLYMRIFLTKNMKKNDYSELQLYSKKEEIFGCVHPRYGRLAIWNDTADFLFKPPSMFFEQGEYSILIRATTDKQKFEDSQTKYEEYVAENLQKKAQPFPYMNVSDEDILKIDIGKHLTRKFTDTSGRVAAVFDNVVPEEELFTLRKYFINKNAFYNYGAYDPDKTEQHDNVNWIVKMKPQVVVGSRIWTYVKQVISYLSNETTWFPYDVAMNIIQHTHAPRIHSDCSQKEHEYTFLMYLSPEWGNERYGETIFVEQAKSKKRVKPGNEKFETLNAVIPRFGRIVAFRNIIDHSARPPSPDFLAARYTFAVKVGRSPEIAKAKTVREILDQFSDDTKAREFQEEIYEGKYDTINDEANDRFLQEKLEFYQGKSDEMHKTFKQSSYQSLKLKQTVF